jgi:hypothetical protein
MSSDPKATPKSNRLPFEPGSGRKKTAADSSPQPERDRSAAKAAKPVKAQPASATPVAKSRPAATDSGTIPAVISQRMGRRVALFSGIPTGLGVLTFFVSYLVVTQDWVKLPNVAVLLVSMGWFGLGVVGLSYGALSTCWDEDRVGTRLGMAEFKTNFGRLTDAWKARPKA